MKASRSQVIEWVQDWMREEVEAMPGHFLRGAWIRHGGAVQNVQHHLPSLEPIADHALDPDSDADLDHPSQPPEQQAEMEARVRAAIAEARAEAERWRSHAEAREQVGYEEGFARGLADGYQQGLAQGEAAARTAMQPVFATFNALIERAIIEPNTALAEAGAALAQLSIAVAREVIGQAFAAQPELLANRLVRLLERLSDVTTAVVHMHPADLAIIQPIWSEYAVTYGWSDLAPRLLGDDTISRGGCVIESHMHNLDARVDTLLGEVAALFADVGIVTRSELALGTQDSQHPAA